MKFLAFSAAGLFAAMAAFFGVAEEADAVLHLGDPRHE